MAQTIEGPNSPETVVNDSSIGSGAWTNPEKVKVNDTDVAYKVGGLSYYLKATNFGFTIPTGMVIIGIQVGIQKMGIGPVVDNAVRIVKGGTIKDTDKSIVDDWPDPGDVYIEHGGSTDLWGESWTAEDINDSTFGMAISVDAKVTQASIDHIRITVYYNLGISVRDNNQITTILGTSNSDGSTPVLIKIDPTSHEVDVDDGLSGSDLSNDIASRDNNHIPVMMGVSSVDGVTPTAVYADPSNGELLIKST